MSDAPKSRPMDTPEPTAGDLEEAIHALHNIGKVMHWLEHDQSLPRDEGERLEAKHGLLIAHRLITEDFRRRF